MKIKLIANQKKTWATKLQKEVKHYLIKHGHSIVDKGADATICIGGDGTILYSNHKKRLQGRVLGIGSDSSYICQLRNHNWKEKLLSLLKTKDSMRIMTLDAVVGRKKFSALNDFVIHATDYRVVHLEVSYSANSSSFEADGIIVSTAVGSAGYAYSAGGKRLRPTDEKITVVPIAPYMRAFSPKELPPDAAVEIKSRDECAFILDGIHVKNLKKGEKVKIKRGSDMNFFLGVGGYER